ncbi:MFS transporter cpaT [Fulvia fulva]|uniref:MFS transporter cpaT n=1 Tax=Passalora fulva TaxID=5499 RepID=A0A9Q8USU8_PASFU|nr:MFS transporter cpaT [Fulvia fulva]KAK4618736.1 MFS transporter cpaT [Fulvia fulva]UJO21173.1 MFS transporter cpaT [Fulvia fulva]WPV33506.1 MFS transporter cpaT [Fulvia fulva]
MSVTIGFTVAITSNFATAFSELYAFSTWQSGLCFTASLIGSGFGIFFNGRFSERVADYFTKRNSGIREPEFRLPAISIGLVTAPLALILLGAEIEQSWHWVVPTVGLGWGC